MNPSRRAAFVALCCLPLATALLPLAAHAATSGSGKAATEVRTVPEFQAIALAGAMDLRVSQGTPQSVTVQADDNLLPLLETVVEDGKQGTTLFVRWKKGQNVYARGKVLVTVVTPKLSALSAAGSGNMKVESFTTPALQLAISGAGDVKLDGLSTDELGVRISGSGDVRGSGKATRMKVSIAGSGDVRLTALRADDVQISIAGSGDAEVFADKTLDVRIAGSGDVTYTGNAALKSSVAGSGSVKRK
jgi:carbon monoxide dehydrogenase subunit G